MEKFRVGVLLKAWIEKPVHAESMAQAIEIVDKQKALDFVTLKPGAEFVDYSMDTVSAGKFNIDI